MTEAAPDPASEGGLIAEALRDKPEAVGTLLYKYYDRLLRRIDRHLPGDVRAALDPQDVLQEAHVRAFRNIGKFQPRGPHSFYPWLATVADNTLTDKVREQRRLKRAPGRRPVAPPAAGSSGA